MKLNLIALFVLSVTICMFSCKKTGTPHSPLEEEGNNKGVIIRLDFPGTRSASRASIEAPVTSNVAAVFSVVDVYFYDKATGIIYFAQTLDATQLATASSVGGLQITDLHANVSAVAIICNNTPSKGLSALVNDNMGTLFSKEVNIALEQDFNYLTYVGRDESLEATETPEGGSDAVDYFEAEVTVAPLVARVEVASIGLDAPLANYSNLNLRSVYVENVYKDGLRLDYLDNFAASNPSSLVALESETEGVTQYWWLEILEAPNTGGNADLSDVSWNPQYGVPAVDGVFAFHIFEKTGGVPTIGLHLNSTLTTPVPDHDPNMYVRYTNYQLSLGNFISTFEAGHIYKIVALFEEPDVLHFPEELVDITLIVTVQEWTIHEGIIPGS